MTARLIRQKHNTPDFDTLQGNREYLMALLDYIAVGSDEWNDGIRSIIDFQDERGGFSLLDSYMVESDVRVDYCYMPTYICTAILMKALILDCDVMTGKTDVLKSALSVCCSRGLAGHGCDSLKGKIEALEVFMKGGLREFLLYYPDLCPAFTEMIQSVYERFVDKMEKGDTRGLWGESYASGIQSVVDYFTAYTVFVYGTLLKGQENHERFLWNSEYLGKASVAGLDMYDIGSFPGIVPGDGTVKGELYEVSKATLRKLDYLEGEGSLYIRKCRCALDYTGSIHLALTYEYNHSVEGLNLIPEVFQPYSKDWFKKC